VSIHESILGTTEFPIQKRDIFYKIKASGNPLRSSGTESPRSGAKKSRDYAEAYLKYAAPVCVQRTGRQVIPQIDAEIVKKSHLWMETK